jgi:hypothetical protein
MNMDLKVFGMILDRFCFLRSNSPTLNSWLIFSLSQSVPIWTFTVWANLRLIAYAMPRRPNVRAASALESINCDYRHYVQICTPKYITLLLMKGRLAESIIYTLKVYT